MEVAGNAILSISYVGYKDREVAVRNRAIIESIQLQPDNQMLEQVVVIGYGTQKKSDLTGSVAVVDAEALKQTSHSNISTMLEGKVSGVQVTSDGQPGDRTFWMHVRHQPDKTGTALYTGNKGWNTNPKTGKRNRGR